MYSLFSPCPRGLEPYLATELESLGLTQVTTVEGGVNATGSADDVAVANLWSRIATRFTIELADQYTASANDLYNLGRKVPWGDWFKPDATLRIDTSIDHDVSCSREFATLKLKDAIVDSFRAQTGSRPSIDKQRPDVRLRLHWAKGKARILIDTSGQPLFKRGWRKATGDAPLRENLAAGLLKIAGYDGSQSLIDPMCGSGTFLVEAADIALARPPGRLRQFAYTRLLPFKDVSVPQYRIRDDMPLIVGNDSDPEVLRCAKDNLISAGLRGIALSSVEVTELEAPDDQGILICNPPYGERMSTQEEISAQYPAWGSWLKNNFAAWQSYWLSADRELPKGMRLSAKRKTPIYNGALDCRLFYIPLVKGSAREL